MTKTDNISAAQIKELFEDTIKTSENLLRAISLFTNEQFNTVPFEGSWTAGQVAEHLFNSQSGLPRLVRGHTKPADRAPDERVEVIKSIFLDFTTKMKSPDFILPTDAPKQKEFFLSAFKTLNTEIQKLKDDADLSLLLTDFPFPQLGELTGYEWLFFANCHSKRHTRQLNNIYAALTNDPVAGNN